jgi:hypothetical protein
MATCIFSFDFRFLNIEIFEQLLILFSCFMKISLYNNKLMPYGKLYIIGRQLNLNKLQNFCKRKYILNHMFDNYVNINNMCINSKKTITSFNLNSTINNKLTLLFNKLINFNTKIDNIIGLRKNYSYSK